MCGKVSKYPYKSQIRRFCSYKCSNQYKWEKLRKRAAMKKIVCLQCENEFQITESSFRVRIKNGNNPSFCSLECYKKYYSSKQKMCPICGEPIKQNRLKTCSVICGAILKIKMKTGVRTGFWYENGYKVIHIGRGEGIKEHRLIMEQQLGRKLLPNEIVHHRNGIKDDNRPENLMVLSASEHHSRHRRAEKLLGRHLFGGYHNN